LDARRTRHREDFAFRLLSELCTNLAPAAEQRAPNALDALRPHHRVVHPRRLLELLSTVAPDRRNLASVLLNLADSLALPHLDDDDLEPAW
jgi:hypothetical protein